MMAIIRLTSGTKIKVSHLLAMMAMIMLFGYDVNDKLTPDQGITLATNWL